MSLDILWKLQVVLVSKEERTILGHINATYLRLWTTLAVDEVGLILAIFI